MSTLDSTLSMQDTVRKLNEIEAELNRIQRDTVAVHITRNLEVMRRQIRNMAHSIEWQVAAW